MKCSSGEKQLVTKRKCIYKTDFKSYYEEYYYVPKVRRYSKCITKKKACPSPKPSPTPRRTRRCHCGCGC
ncbi:hypothetical protein [Paenibacillus jiagnxiensis]|uniref:hypothetical protein n=1 Tax=Paenibacillus jiagnxiensis TaxID=3228926 RepID=UPI0033A62E9F